jgi:putative membrane protein
MKRSFYMATVFISALLMTGCDGNYGPMDGGWNHMMNYGYGNGYGGMFMWILLVIVIVIVVYFIIRSMKRKP